MKNKLEALLKFLKRLLPRRQAPTLRVVLYTRAGCHLCHDASALLRRYQKEWPLLIEEIDIDRDPELIAKYGDKVPVVEINGQPRLWGKINEMLLRRTLKMELRA